MRRLPAVLALALLSGPARADQLDAVGALVEMVVFPVATVLALVVLGIAYGVRSRSPLAAAVVAGLGLLPLAGFGALVVGEGGILFLFLAAVVASLFAVPSRPPPIE